MSRQLLLVRDGLDGAAPWMSQVLRDAGFDLAMISAGDLAAAPPAVAVMLRIHGRDPIAACWDLHRQGHGAIVAVSPAANSQECIRLLNAGADYYLDAWLTPGELVARIHVVLRVAAWREQRTPGQVRGPLRASA